MPALPERSDGRDFLKEAADALEEAVRIARTTRLEHLCDEFLDQIQEDLTQAEVKVINDFVAKLKERSQQPFNVVGDLPGQTLPRIPAREAEESIQHAVELIDADPSIVERLLPVVGELMQRIANSPQVLTRKEVAESLDVSPGRVNQLLESGLLPGVHVLSQTLYPRTPVEAVKQTERPPGRPAKK
jgi:hypothetical protein